MNSAYQLALKTAAAQRLRTTKFFADELRQLLIQITAQRKDLYDNYTNAQNELMTLPEEDQQNEQKSENEAKSSKNTDKASGEENKKQEQ